MRAARAGSMTVGGVAKTDSVVSEVARIRPSRSR